MVGYNDVLGNANHIANINPIRYRSYYYDTETGFYYLQSGYYDPVIGRFINADGYVSTGQGISGYNMYSYCNNNPTNERDDTGTIAGAAVSGVSAALKFVVMAAAAVVSFAAIRAITKNPPRIPSFRSRSRAQTRSKSKAESKDATIPKSQPTVIYRYYASKTENIAPRVNRDFDGLSFSTKPPKNGISAIVTTIEEVNSTGVLTAVQDGSTHVTIRPTNATVLQWMNEGEASIWSQTLSSIVIEWDGDT